MSTHPSEDDELAARARASSRPEFATVYDEHFPFVWRSARRLGVDPSAVDDVVQDVFVVVHRRLADFEGRSSLKTWLFGILLRVVRDHRRTLRRKHPKEGGDLEAIADTTSESPHESAEKAEGVRLLHALLDALDDDKREVFVLAELEQMTVPEIADATDSNVNTVYSRLRAARREFDAAVCRHHARRRDGAGEMGQKGSDR